MAHPYHHSISSARKFGGIPEDYLTLHSMMDSTKGHIPDARHRLVMHNSWGIFCAERLVGKTLTRKSDNKTVPTRLLLEQHVKEDFSFIPTLDECFKQLPVEPFEDGGRDDRDNANDHSWDSVHIWGGYGSDYWPIHSFLNHPRNFFPDWRYQRLLHNSFGVALLEQHFGEYYSRPSDGEQIPTRYIAYAHIRRDMGHVPTLSESLEGIVVESWMHRKAQNLSIINERIEHKKGA